MALLERLRPTEPPLSSADEQLQRVTAQTVLQRVGIMRLDTSFAPDASTEVALVRQHGALIQEASQGYIDVLEGVGVEFPDLTRPKPTPLTQLVLLKAGAILSRN